MWAIWSGFQFRVCLGGDEEWMIFDLDHFYNSAIRRQTGKSKTMVSQDLAVIIIDFITMSVTFCDLICTIKLKAFVVLSRTHG